MLIVVVSDNFIVLMANYGCLFRFFAVCEKDDNVRIPFFCIALFSAVLVSYYIKIYFFDKLLVF